MKISIYKVSGMSIQCEYLKIIFCVIKKKKLPASNPISIKISKRNYLMIYRNFERNICQEMLEQENSFQKNQIERCDAD